MNIKLFFVIVFSSLVSIFALPVQSSDYEGTCYFNSQKMTCSVTHRPNFMMMKWEDGVIESYSHQHDGTFIDSRGGIWKNNSSVEYGMLLEHKNGNSIRFVENH